MLELGAILWFPCILWNCNNPEKLWALNPKKLLLPDAQMGHINETEVTLRDRSQDQSDAERLALVSDFDSIWRSVVQFKPVANLILHDVLHVLSLVSVVLEI